MRLDKKKMIAAAIVACTTLFIAIGIHEKKDTRKQLKFGATYMTMNNPYFVNMDENIEESVQAKGDILITRDPLQDQKKQNEQIKDMITEGIDVLFLQPVDRNKVRPALELCKKSIYLYLLLILKCRIQKRLYPRLFRITMMRGFNVQKI